MYIESRIYVLQNGKKNTSNLEFKKSASVRERTSLLTAATELM